MGDGALGSAPRIVSKKEGLGWVNWIDGSKRLGAARSITLPHQLDALNNRGPDCKHSVQI